VRDLRAAALAAALALAAGCGSGLPGRDPLEVNTFSGGKANLSNTVWEVCTNGATGGSYRYREAHGEEGAITIIQTPFDAPDCTGAAGTSVPTSAYGEARGDIAVTWAGTPPAGAPNPPPLATKVLLQAGGYLGDVYLLDDRDPAHRVLYTGDLSSPLDDSGYPLQLHAAGERQVQ
jgi:hypothetical protein